MRPCENCDKEFNITQLGQELCELCTHKGTIVSKEAKLIEQLDLIEDNISYILRNLEKEIDNVSNVIAVLEDRRVRLNRTRLIDDLERIRLGLNQISE